MAMSFLVSLFVLPALHVCNACSKGGGEEEEEEYKRETLTTLEVDIYIGFLSMYLYYCKRKCTHQYQTPSADETPKYCLLCHLTQSLHHQQELWNEDTLEHHWNTESAIFYCWADNKKCHQMF